LASVDQPKRSATIDADKLYEMLGLPTDDPAQLSWSDRERLGNLKFAVQQAELVGRIQRYARKDPKTRETLGHCYLRDEIRTLLRNRG
jgi:hypothetical protein